jgi:2,3-bisphosphoglycerate-independent phosphoglycerate mutase
VTADVDGLRDGGVLADVAPTVLALLGEDEPDEMTGESLVDG